MITKYEIIYWVISGIAILIVFTWIVKTEKRLKVFFFGKKAKDLEDTIMYLKEEIDELKKSKEKIQKELELVNQKLKKSIRGVGTVRFNPFADQGSNQSFAIGMLNEDGDGVVVSSLYSRERMSVFAKPIKNNSSEYELSNEEKEALKKAEVK